MIEYLKDKLRSWLNKDYGCIWNFDNSKFEWNGEELKITVPKEELDKYETFAKAHPCSIAGMRDMMPEGELTIMCNPEGGFTAYQDKLPEEVI